MSDLFSATELNPIDLNRIKRHLEKIREAQSSEDELVDAINAATSEFNDFFLKYGLPSFSAKKLERNDTPRSKVYNENILTLSNDLEDLYRAMETAIEDTLAAFNYATISAQEINNKAQANASKVLDLNILSDFVKGQAIVGGDDFIDNSKIDTKIGVDTNQAIVLDGASAIALVPVSSEIVSTPDVEIKVTPVLPTTEGDNVNRKPTPGNIERFYEGHYYAAIGDQKPEGGSLKLKYIVDPQDVPEGTATTTLVNGQIAETTNGGASELAASTDGGVGFYAVVQPTEEELKTQRLKMVDGNPSSYWECEIVYKVPSLIDPFLDQNAE